MNRRPTAIFILTALFVLLLAACQPATAPTPTPEPAEVVEAVVQRASLSSTAWTVLSYGVEEDYAPVPGSNPSIEFGAIRYTGFTGCNYFLGTFDAADAADGANSILMKYPSITVGLCDDEALLEQELNFLTALTTADEYRVEDGDLVLSYGGTDIMTMDELEPVPFEGTEWTYRFQQGDTTTWQAPLPDTTITALFEDGTVSGSAGCNDYSGTYTISNDEITIGEISLTRKSCPEPEGVMEQESHYVEWLQNAGSIDKSARSFELRDTDGLPLMLFSAD